VLGAKFSARAYTHTHSTQCFEWRVIKSKSLGNKFGVCCWELKKVFSPAAARHVCTLQRENGGGGERARIQYAKQPNYTENEISKTGIPEYIAQTRFGLRPINIIFPIHGQQWILCNLAFNGQSAKAFVFMDLKMRQRSLKIKIPSSHAIRQMIFNLDLSASLNAI
jgi:hypothetical protein